MYFCPQPNVTFVPSYAWKCGGGAVPSCYYTTVCVKINGPYPGASPISYLFGTDYCDTSTYYGCGLSPTEAILADGYCNNQKSDIRLKENMVLVGESETGINIYQFNYKNEEGLYEGVIAQEFIGTEYENALSKNEDNLYVVDYNKIDVEFKKIK
jgi:hypothetical protein